MVRKQRKAKKLAQRRCRRKPAKPANPMVAAASNQDDLRTLWDWFLPGPGIFSEIRFHGNIKWTPTWLVWLALCWAWAEARCLTDSFVEALGVCESVLGCSLLGTYQGFMGAAVVWTPKLMPVLQSVLQRRMQEIGGRFWRIAGWVPIAFDGSRSSAPRTRSNEAAFCAKNYGKGKTSKYRKKKSKGLRRKRNRQSPTQPQEPQVWMTMLWHMGLRLPWTWRLGPSNSSERAHVMDILASWIFPRWTLFCGDAGFVGYPLWARVIERGHDFLVRVGANVSLLQEHARCTFQTQGKGKRKERIVLCWPKEAQRAKQPPLRLRLLQVHVGKTSAWLLTSVLDSKKLTAAMALQFYTMRWGIEVEFRGLKQTLDRAKLRSRQSQRLLTELEWSILAMAVAELFALKEQRGNPRRPIDPAKRSLAGAMRALRKCLRNLNAVPQPDKNLASQLQAAVTDSYHRKATKGARYRPKNPDKKPLGDPKIRPLNRKENHKLQRFEAKMAA